MPQPIGTVIEDGDIPGISDSGSTASASGRVEESTNGTPGQPEEIRGYETVDLGSIGVESIGGAGGGDSPRQRRKRGPNKPKFDEFGTPINSTSTAKQAETVRKSLTNLTDVLLTLHSVSAALLGIKELALDPKEAKQMGDATAEVLKYYPLGISEKHLAIVDLVLVCGGIYGTRIMAYNIRRSAEKGNKVVSIAGGRPPEVGKMKTNGFPTPEMEVKQTVNDSPFFNPPVEPASDEGLN